MIRRLLRRPGRPLATLLVLGAAGILAIIVAFVATSLPPAGGRPSPPSTTQGTPFATTSPSISGGAGATPGPDQSVTPDPASTADPTPVPRKHGHGGGGEGD